MPYRLLAPTLEADPLMPPPPEEEPYTKHAGTQTKYRESEAQTEPYAPQYRVPTDREEPELLMLKGLTMGKYDVYTMKLTKLEYCTSGQQQQ